MAYTLPRLMPLTRLSLIHISLAFDLFGPVLKEEVNKRIYRRANPGLTIQPTALGYNGGLCGAAAVAFRGVAEKGAKE